MTSLQLGYPVLGRNKYRNLALQVGGVSKIELNILMSPSGFKFEKGCTGDARQKLKTTHTTSRQRGRPTSTNPQLSKNNLREKTKKSVAGSRWEPDTKRD
jgi:hypothetical protein